MAARRNHHESGESTRLRLWEITGPRHTRSYRDKNGFVSDALVEKEVIPEVLNELICIEGRL